MGVPFDIGVFVFKLPEEQDKHNDIKKWICDCHIDWDEDYYISNNINGVIYGDVNVYLVLEMDRWPRWYYGKNSFG